MRFSHRRNLPAILSLAVLACSSDSGVTPGPPPPPPAWSEITNLPSSITLYSLWAPREDLVIGVGRTGHIWQWDGRRWTRLGNPSADDLFGIDGSTTGSVLAVGDKGAVLEQTSVSFAPVDAGTTEDLRGVWQAESGLFVAVGENGVIVRRTGTTWSADATPTHAALQGVWGSGDSDIFAVGTNGTILHHDGNGWSSMPSGTAQILSAVSGNSATDVYAAGSGGTLLRYDGASWSPINSGTTSVLQSVCAECGPAVAGANGVVARFVNNTWTRETIAGAPWLYDIARAGNSLWASGAHGQYRHDGVEWSTENQGTVPILRAVAHSSATGLVAVGENGSVMLGGPRNWRYEDAGALSRLNAVWISPSGEIFAAGINRIFRRTDAGWVSENTELVEYFDVGGNADHVYAVGSDGAIRERRGTGWAGIHGVTAQDLHAVRMTSSSGYMVGTGGNIVGYDGTHWQVMYTRSNAVLWDVATVQTRNWRALAVGENGLCIGLSAVEGAGWSTIRTPVPNALYRLAWGPGDHLHAVGANGTVLRFVDEQWAVVNTPASRTFRGVCAAGDAMFVCGGSAGAGGAIFRYGPPLD